MPDAPWIVRTRAVTSRPRPAKETAAHQRDQREGRQRPAERHAQHPGPEGRQHASARARGTPAAPAGTRPGRPSGSSGVTSSRRSSLRWRSSAMAKPIDHMPVPIRFMPQQAREQEVDVARAALVHGLGHGGAGALRVRGRPARATTAQARRLALGALRGRAAARAARPAPTTHVDRAAAQPARGELLVGRQLGLQMRLPTQPLDQRLRRPARRARATLRGRDAALAEGEAEHARPGPAGRRRPRRAPRARARTAARARASARGARGG